MKIPGMELDVFFGAVDDKPVDWRSCCPDVPETDADELPKTPEHVVAILGFDPLDSENSGDPVQFATGDIPGQKSKDRLISRGLRGAERTSGEVMRRLESLLKKN